MVLNGFDFLIYKLFLLQLHIVPVSKVLFSVEKTTVSYLRVTYEMILQSTNLAISVIKHEREAFINNATRTFNIPARL